MLDITTEYRHGILFVRLAGSLVKRNVKQFGEAVTKLIEEGGITNVVFNLDMITAIDKKGIESLIMNYNLVNKHSGLSMLCANEINVHNILKENRIFKFFHEVTDELSAMRVIERNS